MIILKFSGSSFYLTPLLLSEFWRTVLFSMFGHLILPNRARKGIPLAQTTDGRYTVGEGREIRSNTLSSSSR
ncbi:hypothetical protein I7I48_00766 [Histoplasma ohiense]|nr:hypothetical protein I7I48_00766 [Histoplasma ohiense (nom. inval.)]